MLRRALFPGAVMLAWTLAALAPARGDEDMRTAAQYVQGLREKHLYDLATDYLEQLRTDPATPADLRASIDFELGQITLEEAGNTGDLVRRKDLLDQARNKIASFVEKNPQNPKIPEASVSLARLLVERGHLAMLTAGELDEKDKNEKTAKLAEARGSFDQARAAYENAATKLDALFKTFPHYLDKADPRFAEREKAHSSLMDAQLQKAVVDYEEGQTYDAGSKERKDYLTKGLAQFEEIYKKYRTQWAGLTARMWQAKCYEEDGDPADVGKALGIYKELLEHQDPRLRPLQRHVAFFKIIAERKRDQFALALDDTVEWTNKYNSLNERRSPQGIGVLLERAKNALALAPTATSDKERARYLEAAIDSLREVVRYPSPYKAEALALLRKYKPKVADLAGSIVKMTFDDAKAAAEQAITAKEYSNAIAILKHAIRLANKAKDFDKLNDARYHLALSYYLNKQYYEAAVIGDFLARKYPKIGLAPKAAVLAMASLADAYNAFSDYDPLSDLNGLLEMAKYTADAFADAEQGDSARMILGQVYHGKGQYDEAIAAFESVRQNSGKWIEARTRVAASHWKKSLALRDKGAPDAEKTADAEVKLALDRLQEAFQARQAAAVPLNDPGLVNNVCDMGEIYLGTSRPQDALKSLEPIAKAQTPNDSAPFKRLTAYMMRAHILTDQIDPALGDMATLEKTGGEGDNLTQLYFGLGKLLGQEMEKLKDKGDSAGLAKMQQSYLKFLTALTNAKAGQTYDSLQWAGDNMLRLGQPKEAEGVFQRVMDSYGKDEAFKAKNPHLILHTRLKLLAALRDQRKWGEADNLLNKLLAENPKAIEPKVELGMMKEAKAAAGTGKWNDAFAQWEYLGLMLRQSRKKPVDYYDAWYHAAYCLFKGGNSTKALQTLKGITRLSPTLGNNAEIKKKYQQLIDQIQREPKRQASLPR